MSMHYKSRCGFLGCDPVQGQCLGFCENKDAAPAPLAAMPEDHQQPEDENRGMQMLAWTFLFALGLGLVLVVGVLAGCGGGDPEPVQLEKNREEIVGLRT